MSRLGSESSSVIYPSPRPPKSRNVKGERYCEAAGKVLKSPPYKSVNVIIMLCCHATLLSKNSMPLLVLGLSNPTLTTSKIHSIPKLKGISLSWIQYTISRDHAQCSPLSRPKSPPRESPHHDTASRPLSASRAGQTPLP
jgi:hypothetical protein